MAVINKTHPEIYSSKRAEGIMYITLFEKSVYFPKQVAYFMGITKGKYVHFINDNDEFWTMFVNEDSDGFALYDDKGLRIASRALSGMIARTTGLPWKTRMGIKKTKSNVNGTPIYTINTKPKQK